MSKPNKPLAYFKVKAIKNEFLLEFIEVLAFNNFIETQQIKNIFALVNEQEQITHFATSYKGGLLQLPALEFISIEDYVNAVKNGFPTAESYYQAQKIGYTNYNDYFLVKECGIDDKEEYDNLRQLGYLDGYTEYKNYNEEQLALIGNFENAYQLYLNAVKNGFEDFEKFKEGRLKGFANYKTFLVAKEKGYRSAAEYQDGLAKGFVNYEDYQSALSLNIRDKADSQRYLNLFSQSTKATFFDEMALLILLSKLPQGKKVSVSKLMQLVDDEINNYKYADTGLLAPWFTQSFSGKESIIEFLQKNESIKEYGFYDTDGEYFETKKLKDRKVVIDGSNVAYNSRQNDGKPTFANIILMVNFLKSKGFDEITIIADAALIHKIKDNENLLELKKICEYLEAPAEMQADAFIIKYVQIHHCLLVSNDTFKDWKMQETWVALNIDYYRLSFMINDNLVILPDLD